MLSRQLEEFGLPLLAGGLADQPVGYLADVMKVRSYMRAREAVEREEKVDGETRSPAPEWAHRLYDQVDRRSLEMADDEDDG